MPGDMTNVIFESKGHIRDDSFIDCVILASVKPVVGARHWRTVKKQRESVSRAPRSAFPASFMLIMLHNETKDEWASEIARF